MPTPPRVLVLDNGELEDICALLTQFGVDFEHIHENDFDEKLHFPSDLLLVTPSQALRLGSPDSWDVDFRPDPIRIVFLAKPGEMAHSTLRNCGCHYIVRRPFHPYTLRLLVLAALHQGPEKRRTQRVPMGSDIGLYEGLRCRKAILADLSQTGCRLLTHFSLETAKAVNVRIPHEVTEGDLLSIEGQVIRCRRRIGENQEDCFSAAIQFSKLPAKKAVLLKKILFTYADMPVMLEGPAVPAVDLDEAIATIELTDVVSFSHDSPLPPPDPQASSIELGKRQLAGWDSLEPDVDDWVEFDEDLARLSVGFRPRAPRCNYAAPIVTFNGTRPGVVRAKNISVSGMLIEPRPDLALGKQLNLELYTVDQGDPFTIPATVVRDDRPDAVALRFEAHDHSLAQNLEELVAHQLTLRTPIGEAYSA